MKKLLTFLLLASPCLAAHHYELYPPRIPDSVLVEADPPGQTHTFPALDTSNSFTGTNTSGNFNAQFFVDGVKYSGCPAAVTAAGTTVGTTISLPGTGPIVNCPATVPENIIVFNYDRTRDWGNQSTCTPPFNAINYSYDDLNVYSMLRLEMCTNHQDVNGVSLGFFSLTNLKNATANGNSGGDGIAGEVVTAGALSGTFQAMQGAEHSVDINSTGGTITDARGVIGYVNTEASSTTAITNAVGVKALGCNAINAGNKPANCYGLEASDQSAVGTKATTRAYSVFSRGRSLFGFSGSSASGGFDCEDHLNVVHPCLTADGSDNLILSAISANGILLQDTAANELKIDGNGVRTFKNFKYTETTAPAASAGIDTCYGDSTAHAILCSYNNGSYFTVPQTIASGTKALNTAAITTATCDAGAAATATGTVSTDSVDWSFNAAPTATNKYGAFLVVYAVPSANTVTFYTCNPSATTSTPTAMTINFSVRRP